MNNIAYAFVCPKVEDDEDHITAAIVLTGDRRATCLAAASAEEAEALFEQIRERGVFERVPVAMGWTRYAPGRTAGPLALLVCALIAETMRVPFGVLWWIPMSFLFLAVRAAVLRIPCYVAVAGANIDVRLGRAVRRFDRANVVSIAPTRSGARFLLRDGDGVAVHTTGWVSSPSLPWWRSDIVLRDALIHVVNRAIETS
jgi:hypothetical protein